MLNYLNAHGNGESDPNSDIGNQGAQILISKIQDTQSSLKGLNLGKTLQVGTADAGAFFNNMVLAAVDYGMANVHP
jgi:exo-beta-1,3-glucanase (GH17 family)